MNTYVLNLIESTVSLYPANASGAPVLGSPVFLGADAENLKVRQKWIKTQSRYTGARYPRNHPLVGQYEINIDRVWMHQRGPAAAAVDYRQYVLVVSWTDEDTGDWQRRTFYGVTISEDGLDNRDVDGGFTEGTGFDAEYMASEAGAGPVFSMGGSAGGDGIPPVSPLLPYQVTWVGEDGTLDLYRYDATSKLFTAVASNDVINARAALVSDAISFYIGFAGLPVPSLKVDADGVMSVRSLQFNSAPRDLDLPRLDFSYAGRRVASVTADGRLFAGSFMDVAEPMVSVAAGGFALKVGGNVLAVISAPVIQAAGLNEQILPEAGEGQEFQGGEGGELIGAEG